MSKPEPSEVDTGPDGIVLGPMDRDFARYCASGDPQLLAQVFDASARQLLQLALHLASSEAAAEDLLQQTFLRIIERHSTYETGRRFLPWAVAILHNEARGALRRARRREQGPESQASEGRDTADLAQECEALEALREALSRLPHRYQEVLRLKLVEGLGNSDIAGRINPTGVASSEVASTFRAGTSILQ